MFSASVRFDNTGFRAYLPKVEPGAHEGTVEAARFMAETWASLVPVDTTSYQVGIYVRTHDTSGYAAAAAAAKAVNPTVQIRTEVLQPARKDAAAVGSVVQHDVFNELGTSRRPARPAFVPAVELTRQQYPQILRRKVMP